VTETLLAAHPDQIHMSNENTYASVQPQYAATIVVSCEECGGSGFDPGGIDPWGPEPCKVCHGAGTQKITKNYLAEAFRIAGNPECTIPVERAHLVAIVQYCRQVVSTAVSSPKAPEPDHARAEPNTSFRHRRAKVAHRYPVIQFTRRKKNVDIRTQRT
jgi:hypothetical protein